MGRPVGGSAGLEGVPLLHREDQVFATMLESWRNQQLARNLAHSTVAGVKRVPY